MFYPLPPAYNVTAGSYSTRYLLGGGAVGGQVKINSWWRVYLAFYTYIINFYSVLHFNLETKWIQGETKKSRCQSEVLAGSIFRNLKKINFCGLDCGLWQWWCPSTPIDQLEVKRCNLFINLVVPLPLQPYFYALPFAILSFYHPFMPAISILSPILLPSFQPSLYNAPSITFSLPSLSAFSQSKSLSP